MTGLYLVRHCETLLNTQKVYYGRTDCTLSQKGILQAKMLREKFKDIDMDMIISSPLKRCTQTVDTLVEENKKRVLIDPDLVELNFGLWEGLNHREIKKKYPDHWEKWVKDWKNSAPPNGESFAEMYHRVKRSLLKIISESKGENIVIVSHKGCLQIIASVLMVGDDELFWNFTFDHGKYSLFKITEGHCVIEKLNC